jgi:hypothetical protein
MAQFSVRSLSPSGDYVMGGNLSNFYIDSPQAVGQCIETRILLFTGEWYLNTTDGTPWFTLPIMGKSTAAGRDAAIRQRILQTPFVTGLSNYSSAVDVRTRAWTVSCTVQTAFGPYQLNVPFTASPSTGPFQLGYSPLGGNQGAG